MGLYQGDLGQVHDMDINSGNLVLKVIPRLGDRNEKGRPEPRLLDIK